MSKTKKIPDCVFCDVPAPAVWKVKGTESQFVCEVHKLKLDPAVVELIQITSMSEYRLPEEGEL